MNKKSIAVAGALIADIFYKTETYPRRGRLTNILQTRRGVGGIGNIIQDFARLDKDLKIKCSAILGKDEEGEFVRDKLSSYSNIDLSNIAYVGETSTTIVIEAEDTKQRTFFYRAAASDIYEEKYIDWDALSAKIFHLEYLLLLKEVDREDEEFGTHGARILYEARKRGFRTSIDVVSHEGDRARKIVPPSLKYTDYCSINECEAESITGISLDESQPDFEKSIYKALNKLKDYGVSTWVVIHMPSCAFGLDCSTGEVIKQKSLKLPRGYIKGTTGAGDAFCCGVLYGAYKEMELKEAMKLAVAAAACSLSSLSGSEGLRPYKEVMEVYEKFKVEEE